MFYKDEFGHFGPVISVGAVRNPPEIQYLDVKELNDLSADFHTEIRALIQEHAKCVFLEEGKATRLDIYYLWARYIEIVSQAYDMTERYLQQIK